MSNKNWRNAEEVFEVTEMYATEPLFGFNLGPSAVQHHPATVCEGQTCCIHNPSDHHMREWGLNWRADRQFMERLCPHGVGHPDPDSLRRNKVFLGRDMGVHGCDGCCQKPEEEQ